MTIDFNVTTLTADERLAEMERILNMLRDEQYVDQMTDKEKDFCSDMWTSTSCSPAQLNWLRRIKDKYL